MAHFISEFTPTIELITDGSTGETTIKSFSFSPAMTDGLVHVITSDNKLPHPDVEAAITRLVYRYIQRANMTLYAAEHMDGVGEDMQLSDMPDEVGGIPV
jgi:hypothetical protein